MNRVLLAGVVGVLAGAAISACMVDREGAPCDRDDNCPRSQYCDLNNKCVELRPSLEASTACQLVLVSLTQRFSECLGGRPEHWLQNIFAPQVCQTITGSVAANRQSYAPMQLKECRRALLSDACSDLIPRHAGEMLEACAVFTGTVASGGSCATDKDCADGYCDASSGCLGTCQRYAGAGDACSDTRLCPPGNACYKGTCQPYVTGGSCDAGPCQPYSHYCDGTQQCLTRRPEGTPGCDYLGAGYFCELNTKCVGPVAFGTRLCTKGLDLGAACPQFTNACAYFTSCQPDGDGGTFCKQDPGPGGNCGLLNGDVVGCTASRCSGFFGGNCLQFVPLGGGCGNNGDCGPLARCVNFVCRAEFCP